MEFNFNFNNLNLSTRKDNPIYFVLLISSWIFFFILSILLIVNVPHLDRFKKTIVIIDLIVLFIAIFMTVLYIKLIINEKKEAKEKLFQDKAIEKRKMDFENNKSLREKCKEYFKKNFQYYSARFIFIPPNGHVFNVIISFGITDKDNKNINYLIFKDENISQSSIIDFKNTQKGFNYTIHEINSLDDFKDLVNRLLE